MKGDFSRLTFDRKKHYSGVLMQQGRVLIDADWNEEQRINRYRMETETIDVVGPSGVPATGGLDILHSSFARSLSVLKAAESDVLKGWIVGAKSSILHWDGKALKAQTAPSGVTATLRSVCFVDEAHGWAVGDQGAILYTDDGGAEWKRQEAKTENNLLCVYGLKAGKEFLGCALGEKGTLLYSNNSGKTWKKQDVNVKARLNCGHILPLPAEKGYKIFAVGDSRTILEYVWDIKKNVLTFTAPKFGTEPNAEQDLYSVNSIVIENAEYACAVGEGGVIFFKQQETWRPQPSGVEVTLKAILAVRNTSTPFGNMPFVLAAVGDDGTVCFSTDGATWLVFRPKLSEKVQAVNFIDCSREQMSPIMTLLGDEGSIFNQTSMGWSRFARMITTLSTSAGRIYVDGILCEFESVEPLSMPDEEGKYLLYLDCWRRHITAAQDPQIRETALGGPDTCTRVQTIGQVRYLPVVSAREIKSLEELRASAKDLIQKMRRVLSAKAASDDAEVLNEATSAMERMANLADEEVVRHLGVNDVRIKDFVASQKKRISAPVLEKVKDDLDAWEKIQANIIKALAKLSPEDAWKKLTAPRPCALAASVKKADTQKNLCSISAGGGYRGLENQLYRVEIHEGSDGQGGATFKWSRDNGSVIFPFEVVSINDNKTILRLTTEDLGSYYPVSKGEWIGAWVEVVNDDYELAGQPGLLMRIADVPSDREMTLEGSLNAATWSNKARHPIIRRWDQRDDAKKSGVVAVVEDQWLELESGVQVRFENGGTYKTGDYWNIPARTDAADVEWPQSSGEPLALPPAGICHHYAKLALLTAYDTGKIGRIVTELHDCRAIFEPIANQTLHVTGINWQNDSVVQFDEALYVNLLKVGFQIMLDDAPDAWTVNPASLVVTVETNNGLVTPVQGIIQVQGNIISWRMKTTAKKAAMSSTRMSVLIESSIFHNMAAETVVTETTTTVTNYRVRIALKGNLIWRTCCGNRIYLDGQVFGEPRVDKDANGDAVVRYDLNFPSGAGNRGSDFESWINLYQVEAKSAPAKAEMPVNKTKGRAAEKKPVKRSR